MYNICKYIMLVPRQHAPIALLGYCGQILAACRPMDSVQQPT